MNGRWGGRKGELSRLETNLTDSRDRSIAITSKDNMRKETDFLQSWGMRLRGKKAKRQAAQKEALLERLNKALED